jgi:hypothetical protein
MGQSTAPLSKMILNSARTPLAKDGIFIGDSLTAIVKMEKETVFIVVNLLLDRLFFTPAIQTYPGFVLSSDSRERPDSFVRIVVALAQEIYGSVQTSLGIPIKDGRPVEDINFTKMGVKTYQAGVDFIDRWQADPSHSGLSDKLKNYIIQARAREFQALSRWQLANCDEGMTRH